MCGACHRHHMVEIVDEMLEVSHHHALSVGVAVPKMVRAPHARAPRDEPQGHVLVATDMLAVTVRDDDGMSGARVRPHAHADRAFATLERLGPIRPVCHASTSENNSIVDGLVVYGVRSAQTYQL